MTRTMCCPQCNHTSFIRKKYDLIEIKDDGQSLYAEVIKDDFEEDVYICRNCNEDVTTSELIPMDELGEVIKERLEVDGIHN